MVRGAGDGSARECPLDYGTSRRDWSLGHPRNPDRQLPVVIYGGINRESPTRGALFVKLRG